MYTRRKIAKRYLTYAQAISEALVEVMKKDPRVFVMGLGVTDYKGIFSTTLEVNRLYGPARVIETPASENALTGIAIGAALVGKRPILVHARNDFMFLTLDQMINCAAKWKYMYAGKSSVPFVVRGIIGKGWGQGPTHSQSIQSFFIHSPGLYVAMPSNPYDVKGALLTAIKGNTPCVILEHRALYDSMGIVPKGQYTIKIGKARVVRRGSDVTVVATSLMVQEAIKAHMVLKKVGISLEIIDPLFLRPLDEETILRSVRKTGRLISADTSWTTCGFTSEISAIIADKAFHYLKEPVRRIGLAQCPAPVSKSLEDEFYPTYKTIFLESCRIMGRKQDLNVIQEEIVDSFKGPY
jgi:acetoin:2,6-dichlorophenolindophenol oxidoreductase subunit beta